MNTKLKNKPAKSPLVEYVGYFVVSIKWTLNIEFNLIDSNTHFVNAYTRIDIVLMLEMNKIK